MDWFYCDLIYNTNKVTPYRNLDKALLFSRNQKNWTIEKFDKLQVHRVQYFSLKLCTRFLHGNTINTLTEEFKEIYCSFKKRESEIDVVKKVNDALVKQLSSVECQCWKNAQYSHWECVEVVGIPSSVKHDQLELTVCRILHHIDVNISGDKIEVCHWLS